MSPYKSPFLISSDFNQPENIQVTPQRANWEHLSFSARSVHCTHPFTWDTGENELALVILGGICSVESNHGNWGKIGRREDVFHGMPWTLYLPRRTQFTLTSVTDHVDIAYGWAATEKDHPARLVTPEMVSIEIRGGDNATRQINKMIPPGFDCDRLIVVEVYTPSGNWSSYPPHKHDVHQVAPDGHLVEADLEEIYFYKIDPADGYAYQRIYTPDGRIDELILAKDNHLVLSPEGYHPVVSAQGYTTYYLNMLAGSSQSLTASDDPQFAWVKENWKSQDPRLPIVSMKMEEGSK